MKCDSARAAYLAGEAANEHLDHLQSCVSCRSLAADLETTRRVLDLDAVWEEPGADLEERVVTLISGTRRDERQKSFGRAGWLAGAAAVAAVLVTAGVIAATRGSGPDWEVALPGTEAAPNATGVVSGWNEPAGTRLVFDIDGLEPAPVGSVYEVWFSRQAVHISAGTFTTEGRIEMWTGIARADYPRIWITLETLDTDESPSVYTMMDTG